MTTYTLKLVSGVNYNLYDGTTLVTDADLATLFGTESEAYFVFDFNSGTPTNTTSLNIVNSNSEVVMANTGLTGIAENKNFKGTWGDSATAFTSFALLPAYGLDEAQLGKIVEKIGEAKEIRTVTFSSQYLNMWDKTIYPDGIYRVEYTGAGYGTITLSDNGYGIPVTTESVNSPGGSYVLLGTVGYYGYRYIVGTASRIPGTGNIGDPMGTIISLYSQNGFTTTIHFIGQCVSNLTSTSMAAPLSANQGKVLADRIGTLSNLTTTAKTSAVVAINEVNAKVLTNAGAPTTSTVGTVGQLLADTTNGKLYICTDATNPYVWEEIGAGGGGIQNALIIREWS